MDMVKFAKHFCMQKSETHWLLVSLKVEVYPVWFVNESGMGHFHS